LGEKMGNVKMKKKQFSPEKKSWALGVRLDQWLVIILLRYNFFRNFA